MGGNDYSALEARLGHSRPSKPISIVMPTYNRADKVARSLAAMVHLEAPSCGFEVVIADDGSTDGTAQVVTDFEKWLDITHVRRPDRGHRLAEICNLGLRTARHDRIVLLQSDMAPSRGLLTAYGRWLDLEVPLLLIGMRQFTCTDHLTPAEVLADPAFAARLPHIRTGNAMWRGDPEGPTEDWRLAFYRSSDWLKAEMAPFRAVVGSNLAFRRADALRIGGFCESFQSWGGEDGEFGYRAFLAGLAMVPVPEAVAFHQEPPGGVNETDRQVGFETSRRLREDLCALPPFRGGNARGSFRTPRVAVDGGGCRKPLAAETANTLQTQVWHTDGRKASACARLDALATATAAPFLLLCGPGWPEAARLPPNLLEAVTAGAVDGVLIEFPGRALLVATRAWNRISGHVDAAAEFDGLVEDLLSRYAFRSVGPPSETLALVK